MSNDFINGLVATAEPVERRRVGFEILAVIGVAFLELIGLLVLMDAEKMAMAYDLSPVQFVAKAAIFGGLAVIAMVLAIHSFDPAAKRVEAVLIAMVGGTLVLSAIFFDLMPSNGVLNSIEPMSGMYCAAAVASLSLPVTLVLCVLMAQGATTQPRRSCLLAGLAGGAFGAFVFALQCPYTSFWYLAVWYGGGLAMICAFSALVLPRFIRCW